LIRFFRDEARRVPQLLDLKPEALQAQGIRALVLDFDGVLAPHDAQIPLPEILSWLTQAQAVFENGIFILSNTPTAERAAFFRDHYPQIVFLRPERPKPFPDGIQTVLAKTGFQPSQVLVLDDRLLTGILMAVSTQAQAKLITKPYIDWRAHPFKEACFYSLRRFDKLLLKLALLF